MCQISIKHTSFSKTMTSTGVEMVVSGDVPGTGAAAGGMPGAGPAAGEMPGAGPAAGEMPTTGSPATTLEDEWRGVLIALKQKDQESEVLLRHIDRYEKASNAEQNVLEDAQETGNELEIKEAQAMINTTKLRVQQLARKREHAEKFKPVAALLTSLRGGLAFEPFNKRQKHLPDISEKFKEMHQGIVGEAVQFGNASLHSNNVNEAALAALHTSIVQKVGQCAAMLNAEAAVWESIEKDLCPGAKKSKASGSDDAKKSKASGSDDAKRSKSSGSDDEDSEEENSKEGEEGSAQKLGKNELFAYLVVKPLPKELEGFLELVGEDKDPWKVRVLKENYHERLNTVFNMNKQIGQWRSILNTHFRRDQGKSCPGWNQPKAVFWPK
jgi:hypothetical protein